MGDLNHLSPHALIFLNSILPFPNTSAPARLRLPVPHVSTKSLKSSLSLEAKILSYIWNELKKVSLWSKLICVTYKLLMFLYLDIKSLYPHLKVNWNVLMCKICIARRLVIDIFPWCNANFVPFPSGTLVARPMRNGSILLIYQCVEMNRTLLLHLKMCNLKMLASLKRLQMKKNSCSFNMGKWTVNEQWYLIGMLDEGMQINDDVVPNLANEVCTWSVIITTCLFPYIGKSKELENIRKFITQGDKACIVLSCLVWVLVLICLFYFFVRGATSTRFLPPAVPPSCVHGF